MVLMLQSSARQTKEQLRLFRDTGKFTSFFPDVDDFTANEELLRAVPNLETNSLASTGADVIRGVSVKQSLGNTLRLVRPVIVIDEGHRPYSISLAKRSQGSILNSSLSYRPRPTHVSGSQTSSSTCRGPLSRTSR
jgi:hypothetical protein